MQRYVSDELTHFVGRCLPTDEIRYDLFLSIIRQGWLRESHRETLGIGFTGNSDSGKPLCGNEAIKTTAVCLCDIPVDTLGVHMKKYGPFGIALPKRFLVPQGATPVHYVALDAKNRDVGIGPLTVGARLDKLRTELQDFVNDLGTYVEQHEGPPPFLTKLSPPGTPPGHKLMGQMAAIQNELEFRVFGQIKCFKSSLAEDDLNNFYMEREWRVPTGVGFRLEEVVRLIMPREFVTKFRKDVPDFGGELIVAEDVGWGAT